MDDSDEDEPLMGRQNLPVARLPEHFDGEPMDGMQYLFLVRCARSSLLRRNGCLTLTFIIGGMRANCQMLHEYKIHMSCRALFNERHKKTLTFLFASNYLQNNGALSFLEDLKTLERPAS